MTYKAERHARAPGAGADRAPLRPIPADYDGAASRASYMLRRIHQDILSATLKPGQKLSSSMMMSRYGIGLSPLREALCQLVGSGLVALESQRGFRVAPVSTDDLRDVIASRRWVEAHALGLSIALGTAEWKARVRAALEEFAQVAAKAGDRRPINSDWQYIHRHLHFALISACDSPTLLQFCSHLYDRFDRYRRLTVPTQALMASTALDHGDIALAAISGRPEVATTLLVRHIDEIANVVASRFTPELAERHSSISRSST